MQADICNAHQYLQFVSSLKQLTLMSAFSTPHTHLHTCMSLLDSPAMLLCFKHLFLDTLNDVCVRSCIAVVCLHKADTLDDLILRGTGRLSSAD